MFEQLDNDYLRLSKWRALRRVIAWALIEGRPLTTRGRWINPLVFALLAVFRRLPALRRVDRPVFIVGTGRSGTTLLGVVLSMHRDVGFLNEPKALWHCARADEDVVGSWTDGPARYRLDAADAGPGVRQALARQYGGWLRLSCSSRLVDKYPELVFRLPFVQALFPDATFVWLQRRGEDTCRSVAQWSATHAVQESGAHADWWGRNDRKWRLLVEEVAAGDADLVPHLEWLRHGAGPLDRAAVEWILAMREGLRMRARLGPALYALRYEELVAAPRETLTALCSACGLAPDERMLAYAGQVIAGERTAHDPAPLAIDPRLQPAFREVTAQLGYA